MQRRGMVGTASWVPDAARSERSEALQSFFAGLKFESEIFSTISASTADNRSRLLDGPNLRAAEVGVAGVAGNCLHLKGSTEFGWANKAADAAL